MFYGPVLVGHVTNDIPPEVGRESTVPDVPARHRLAAKLLVEVDVVCHSVVPSHPLEPVEILVWAEARLAKRRLDGSNAVGDCRIAIVTVGPAGVC